MSTLFTRIVRGEIPCHKLYEDDRFFSFLDIRPVAPGHALLIPKQETDYLFDLDDQLLGDLFVTARPIARALAAVVPCERVGIMVAGLEVPHCHVHLVPIRTIGDLSFANAKPAAPEDLARLAEQVRALLNPPQGT